MKCNFVKQETSKPFFFSVIPIIQYTTRRKMEFIEQKTFYAKKNNGVRDRASQFMS